MPVAHVDAPAPVWLPTPATLVEGVGAADVVQPELELELGRELAVELGVELAGKKLVDQFETTMARRTWETHTYLKWRTRWRSRWPTHSSCH